MSNAPLARNTWYMEDHCATAWKKAAHLAQRVDVRKGKVIYCQGELIEQMYFVLEGEVELRSVFPDGEAVVFDLLGSNSMFGESAALTGQLSLGAATALKDCVLLSFKVDDLRAAFPQYPELALACVQVLAARQYSYGQRLLNMFRGESWGRVGEFLHRMMLLHGKPATPPLKGTELAVGLTHEEIAGMAGLSRVSVTRVLMRMRTEGVIAIVDRRIFILDAEKLRFHSGL